jgi:hypothetical protein
MKKNFLPLLLLVLFAAPLAAQVHFTAGPVGGATFSSRLYHYKTDYEEPSTPDMGTAASYGVVMNLRFNKFVSLQTQVLYQSYTSGNVEKIYKGPQLTDEYKLNYVHVPLNLVLDMGSHPLMHFMFFIGPYFEKGLGGTFTREWNADYLEDLEVDAEVEFGTVPVEANPESMFEDGEAPAVPVKTEDDKQTTYLNPWNVGATGGLGLKVGPVYVYGGMYYGFINMKAEYETPPSGYSRGDMDEKHYGGFVKAMVLIPDWEGPHERARY